MAIPDVKSLAFIKLYGTGFSQTLGYYFFELMSQNNLLRFDSTRAHAGVGFVMMG